MSTNNATNNATTTTADSPSLIMFILGLVFLIILSLPRIITIAASIAWGIALILLPFAVLGWIFS